MKNWILIIILLLIAAISKSFGQTTTTYTRSIRWATADADSINFATQNLMWYGPNGIRFSEGGVKYSLKSYTNTFGTFWKISGTTTLLGNVTIDGIGVHEIVLDGNGVYLSSTALASIVGESIVITSNTGDITIESEQDINLTPSNGEVIINGTANTSTIDSVLVIDDTGRLYWRDAATIGGSGIGGSTGSTDNSIIRADGTGGSTIQSSSVIIDDNANTTFGIAGTTGTARIFTAVGTATNIGFNFASKGTGSFQFGTTTNTTGSADFYNKNLTVTRHTNTATDPAIFELYKTRGTTLSGQAVIQNGDEIGATYFSVWDGNSSYRSAEVRAVVNGTVADNDVPSELQFLTHEAGSGRTEKLRLTSTGIGNNTSGLKHSRVTTGSITASSTALVIVTWSTTFADSNYTVNASVVETTQGLEVVNIDAVNAGSVVVAIRNTTGGDLTGTIHVIAMHD